MNFWIKFVIETAVIVIALRVYHVWMLKVFTDGTLKMDTSNPAKDVYRLEIENLDKLKIKKRIVLKVDHNANLSQE